MILSGLAFDLSLKRKSLVLLKEIVPVYKAIAELIDKKDLLKKMSYIQLATIVWSFSLLKQQNNELNYLWDKIQSEVENFAERDPYLVEGENFMHTLVIGKGLTYIHNSLNRFPLFWQRFHYLTTDPQTLQNKVQLLKWHDLSHLLFTCS